MDAITTVVTEDVEDHVQYIGAYCRLAQNIRLTPLAAHTITETARAKGVGNRRHQDAIHIVDQEEDLTAYRKAMVKIHTVSGG